MYAVKHALAERVASTESTGRGQPNADLQLAPLQWLTDRIKYTL